MVKFFSPVFLFVPFVAFGVTNGNVWDCNLYCDGGGHCSFICSSGEDSGGAEPPDALTQGQCLKMKEDMKGALSSAEAAAGVVDGIIDDMLNKVTHQLNEVSEIDSNCQHIIENEEFSSDTSALLADNRAICGQMMTELGQNQDALRDSREAISKAMGQIQGARSELANVSCSSKQCTQTGAGGGCGECHDDLVGILGVLNSVNTSVKNIEKLALENLPKLASIASSASNIAAYVEIVGERLKAPDDRLWPDLDALYRELGDKENNYVHSSLVPSALLHDFQSIIDGQDMLLSSEGVIALYQLLFDMFASYQRAASLEHVETVVDGYTNSILSLFRQYQKQTVFSPSVYPVGTKLDSVVDAFTNSAPYSSSAGPRLRFHKIFQSSRGGVTNWFMRMELYQQAALGWFDNLYPAFFESNQAKETKDNLEYQLEYTTNNLHVVSESVSNTFLVTEAALHNIVSAFGSVEIVAELPSEIEIFPETEIGSFGRLDAIVFYPSEVQEYCDVARNFTTLVWRLMIWSLYVIVAVGIARLLFIVILYIIHFIQNL